MAQLPTQWTAVDHTEEKKVVIDLNATTREVEVQTDPVPDEEANGDYWFEGQKFEKVESESESESGSDSESVKQDRVGRSVSRGSDDSKRPSRRSSRRSSSSSSSSPRRQRSESEDEEDKPANIAERGGGDGGEAAAAKKEPDPNLMDYGDL